MGWGGKAWTKQSKVAINNLVITFKIYLPNKSKQPLLIVGAVAVKTNPSRPEREPEPDEPRNIQLAAPFCWF